MKTAPGTAVVPVVPDPVQVDVTHAAGRCREAGQGRAAVNEIGVACGAAALRSADQEVVDVVSAGGDAVDVAGVGDGEARPGLRNSRRRRSSSELPDWPSVSSTLMVWSEPERSRSGHDVDRAGVGLAADAGGRRRPG